MKITIETRDGLIWNKDNVAIQIAKCMSTGSKLEIDLNLEGPDCKRLGLYDLLEKCAELFDYDVSYIDLYTCNLLEQHNTINVIFQPSLHLLTREFEKEYYKQLPGKNANPKHFGRFIGKSNAPRLLLSAYLDKNYANKSIQSYQFKFNDDYHRDEIGLESLITDFDKQNILHECKFLQTCPREVIRSDFKFVKDNQKDFSSQLHDQQQGEFIKVYKNFFVEIVSESYYTGKTFFITEKTFRPMLLKTPFIIQGPRYFLHFLKDLGFKTFDSWWDEGYSEDPASHQPFEIQKTIDSIAEFSYKDLNTIYNEMQDILEHNYKRCLTLSKEDLINLRKQIVS